MEETLCTPFPEASICLSAPSFNAPLPLSPLSPYPFTFLNTPTPPPVDLHPPPPKFPLGYFHFRGEYIFIPPMFIHDRGSEREIRSQVLSRPPEGCEGSESVSKHTSHSTHAHEHIKQTNKQKIRLGTHTQVHVCVYPPTNTHRFSFLVTYKRRRFVGEAYRYQIETEPSASHRCLSRRKSSSCFFFKIFFWRGEMSVPKHV